MIMGDPDYERAYQCALKFLTVQRRTARGLARRLSEKGFEAATVRGVVQSLQQIHLIDDEEFARQFVLTRSLHRPQGKLSLQAVLERKGVARDLAKRIVGDLGEEYEFETARELASRQAGALCRLEPTKRVKRLYDFLKRKGFHFTVCREVAREMAGGAGRREERCL